MSDLQTLVDGADSTELLIAVDRLVAGRDWDGLVDLARRCLEAVEYGRQLWPVAMHIDYRLALEGPAAYAGAVLRPGVARFALGPLTEVAASTHDWASLAPHVADPASATAVAQERVLRGEDLRGRGRGDDGLPLTLAGWEPAYALPRYRDRSAAFPQPDAAVRLLPGPGPRTVAPAQPLNEDDAVQALRDLVETWTAQSSGTVNAMVVDGEAEAAVGALLADRGAQPAAGMLPIALGDALALMQWTGASGGAYGRRPGGARGRFAAWWAATAIGGLTWPPDPADLGHTLGELRWYRWSPPEAETGWVLRLAVADPIDGLAWAVEATDHRGDEEEEA